MLAGSAKMNVSVRYPGFLLMILREREPLHLGEEVQWLFFQII